MDKAQIRRQIQAQKRRLTQRQIEEASARLTARLLALPAFLQSGSLYAYLSYNQEVRTGCLLRRAQQLGKRVAVPRVTGAHQMQFFWLDDLDRVRLGYHGIPEPIGDEPAADDPDALMLLPGLAFDREGHRIGYGGGFYDRFLSQETHPTVALCYGFQLLDELPSSELDIPVDQVLADPG